MDTMIQLKNISFSYHRQDGEIKALSDISFTVKKGEFVSIVGPSGCGKSTILWNYSSGTLRTVRLLRGNDDSGRGHRCERTWDEQETERLSEEVRECLTHYSTPLPVAVKQSILHGFSPRNAGRTCSSAQTTPASSCGTSTGRTSR